MKQKIIKQVNYWLGVTAIGLVLGFSLQFARAWTEPAVAPPGGNVGAPINTSDNPQSKQAGLALNTAGHFANGLLIPNGKVGIGTTNPGAKLDVKGALMVGGVDGTVYITDSDGGADNTVTIGMRGNRLLFWDADTVPWKSKMALNLTSGNVGIGTASPGAKLTIGQDGQNWNDGLRLIRGGNHWDLLTGDSGKLWVGLNDSSKMVMDTSGNIGIGTANPAKKLDVKGDIITDAGITLGGVRRTTWPGEASDPQWYFGKTSVTYNSSSWSTISGGTEGVDYFKFGGQPLGDVEIYAVAECPAGTVPVNCACKMTRTVKEGAGFPYQIGAWEIYTTFPSMTDVGSGLIGWTVSHFRDDGKCWTRMYRMPNAKYTPAVMCR